MDLGAVSRGEGSQLAQGHQLSGGRLEIKLAQVGGSGAVRHRPAEENVQREDLRIGVHPAHHLPGLGDDQAAGDLGLAQTGKRGLVPVDGQAPAGLVRRG